MPARAWRRCSIRIGSRLESIAQRADVVKAISSENVVAIRELLGRAAQAADIDGILVVDTKLRVFGAHSDKVDIVAANTALQDDPVAEDIRAIVSDNDRKRPRVVRRTLALDADGCARDLARTATSPLTFVVAEPIFDDFGDVFAALVAHRSLRPREAVLEEFSRLEGAGLAVMNNGASISIAGFEGHAVEIPATARRIAVAQHRRPLLVALRADIPAMADMRTRPGQRASRLAQRAGAHRRNGRPLARLVADRGGRRVAVLFAGIMFFLSQRISSAPGADHRGGARCRARRLEVGSDRHQATR